MISSNVCVLLSSYNGERHLLDQVNSILDQDYQGVSLLIRDDGSSDGTVRLLRELAKKHSTISIIEGCNKGVVGSFFSLLQSVPGFSGYVALSDQDDIWLPGKLARAVAKLEGLNGPAMYCSRYRAVNSNMEMLWTSDSPRRMLTLSNALVENVATGCTVVLNKCLLDLMNIDQIREEKVLMHDWWIYLVGSALGRVVFDDYVSILYRQHTDNVVGARIGFASWVDRIRGFFGRRRLEGWLRQAEEFLRVYKDQLPSKEKEILVGLLQYRRGNLGASIKYSVNTPLYRQRRIDSFILRCLLFARQV